MPGPDKGLYSHWCMNGLYTVHKWERNDDVIMLVSVFQLKQLHEFWRNQFILQFVEWM
jgi:hypothetical protein